MEKKDTIPVGIAAAVFVVLGVLVVGAFIFAGVNIVNWRNNASTAVLALGKSVQPAYDIPMHGIDAEEDPYALTMEVHGRQVSFAHSPEVVNYRTYVPVRGVFEALGYVVNWDEETGTAMFVGDENTIILKMDDNTFTVNGEVHTMDTSSRKMNGVAMFPIEPIISSLGYGIAFNNDSNTFFIFDPPPQLLATDELEDEDDEEPTAPAAARPAAPLATVTCHSCNGGRTAVCHSCNGIGGGRGTAPLLPGIPYAVAAASDVWWCTTCTGTGTVSCRTCTGTGRLTVGR